ncbi:MAG: hypothetical protein ACJZ9G_10205 [Rhodospirillales bacterium]
MNNGDVKKNLFLVIISKHICNNKIEIEMYLRTSIASQSNMKLAEIINDNRIIAIFIGIWYDKILFLLIHIYFSIKKKKNTGANIMIKPLGNL